MSDLKVKYVVASGSAPVEYFTRFCVSRTIGTHGEAPSCFGCKTYSSYNEALDEYNNLPKAYKPYSPVLGLDSEGYSWYLMTHDTATLEYYASPTKYVKVVHKNGKYKYLTNLTTYYDALSLTGCLDSGL